MLVGTVGLCVALVPSPHSLGAHSWLLPIQSLLSRRLKTQFCASCHLWSAFCLAALFWDVLLPLETGSWGKDCNWRWGGTESKEATAGTWSLWLCLQELLFGYWRLNLLEMYFCFLFKHKSSNVTNTHSLSNMSVTPGAADSLQVMSSTVTVVVCYFSLQQLCVCSVGRYKHAGACYLWGFDTICEIDMDCPMPILIRQAPQA